MLDDTEDDDYMKETLQDKAVYRDSDETIVAKLDDPDRLQ